MSDEVVKVALIGMSENEQKRLNAAFDYSKNRSIAYVACELQDADPAVLMVNADDPEQLFAWQNYKDRLAENNGNIPPSVMVSRDREFQTEAYKLRRPLIASRVINLLDQIRANCFEHVNNDLEADNDPANNDPDVAEVLEINNDLAAGNDPANNDPDVAEVLEINSDLAADNDPANNDLDVGEVLEINSDLAAGNDLAIMIDDSPDIINIGDAWVVRSADKSEAQTETCKVLVVDDSLPVRIQMDQALKQFDADVDFAKTGEEAFDYINNNDYDVIFLDVVLPGVDGYEICKFIKEDKTKDTPVIMLTGNSSPQDKIKGKLVGCDTYLIKPVGKVVFREVMNQYL